MPNRYFTYFNELRIWLQGTNIYIFKVQSKIEATLLKLKFWVDYILKESIEGFFNLLNILVDSNTNLARSSSFDLLPIRGRHSRYLHFYNMAFVSRLDALPATKPLFQGKTGPPVCQIKVGASR